MFYAFTPDKKDKRPLETLEDLGFEGGTLVADGGSKFDPVDLDLSRGGWSHYQRYFLEAAVVEERAKLVLPTFKDLFMIERELGGLDPEEAGWLSVRSVRPRWWTGSIRSSRSSARTSGWVGLVVDLGRRCSVVG